MKENHIIQIIKNIDLKNESKCENLTKWNQEATKYIKISQYTEQNENDNKIDDL